VASNALVNLTNTSPQDYVFSVDMSKPIKFVSRLILPASSTHEIEVEAILPLVLFDRSFQNAVANGIIVLNFSFITTSGHASTSEEYLRNIQRFLGANYSDWEIT
jgi:hypothetical protein